MISANLRDAPSFLCNACKGDLRVIPSGGEPSNPCVRCGGREWVLLTDEERRGFFDRRSGERFEVARVFFCVRPSCRLPIVRWEGGIVSAPCPSCGSRMFEELVGPNKATWLRENERRFQ